MRHSYYRQISLAPLSADSVGEMVNELVGEDPSLAPLAPYLVARTGGNPFFLEEMVRALIEDGTLAGPAAAYRLSRPLEQVGVPASVQSVLAARIDRLSAEHKAVLQTAAVIGRTFAETLLARLLGQTADELGEALSALCAAELLQEEQRIPSPEYRFWHPLTQEVAYGTMLAGRRSQLHAAVAEALIENDPNRLDEGAAVVAWHWEQAGQKLNAARWSLRAGEFALRFDLEDAQRRWRFAVELLEGAEEGLETLDVAVRARQRLLQFGARTGIAPEEADRLEREGRVLGEQLGDLRLLTMIVVASGSARYWAGDVQGGLARFLEAAKRAEQTDDKEIKAVWIGPSFGFTAVGPLTDGLFWANRCIEACDGSPEWGVSVVGYSPLARIHQFRSTLFIRMGRLPEAEADVELALSLSRPRSEPETLCWSLAMLPLLAWLSGDIREESQSAAEEAVRVAEDTGNPASLVLALEGAALCHLMTGQAPEAVAACEQGLAVGRDNRSGLFAEASVLAHLALSRLAAGDGGGAKMAADEAVMVARRQGARVHECLALFARARVSRLSNGDERGAGADLDAGLTLVEEVRALTYKPFMYEELGRLRTSDRELRDAARLYETIGAHGHARRLHYELGLPISPASGH
jgi:adenylate cyclase